MKKTLLLIVLLLWFNLANAPTATAQFPIADYLGRWISETTSVVQQASLFINRVAEPLVNTFKEVQGFFQKAHTFVNGAITNLRYIERIVDLQKDIRDLFTRSIAELNKPRDADLDGNDDLDFLDKWKHAQILLAISAEATKVTEIFTNVIDGDSFTMDDKGRIQFIQETYDELVKLKAAMKLQTRRINREMYQYQRLHREVEVFEKLFE